MGYCDANSRIAKPKRKGPAVLARPFLQRPTLCLIVTAVKLAIPVRTLLALTIRILLLLSGLLAAALLLARLLSGLLVLLPGILVLIGHCDLPFSSRKGDNRGTATWLRGDPGSTHVLSPLFPSAQHENFLCTRS
jgi:hypothetical protein